MRKLSGLVAAGLALLLQGCFEIEGDVEDPYIKSADMAAPLRPGFYDMCLSSPRSAPECVTGEVQKKNDGYDLIEFPASMDDAERAKFDAARAALQQVRWGEFVFKRLEVPAEWLAELTPAEAEVESAPLFLVGHRSISKEGAIQSVRYGLARYDAEGYWEMWEPKCADLPVGALSAWVKNGRLSSSKEKLADFGEETCTFLREGLDDALLRLVLTRADKSMVRRLYWRGEENPEARKQGQEQ